MADIDLRVPVFDFDTGEFVTGLDGTVKTVTGSEAVGMIAVKAEETERGVLILKMKKKTIYTEAT